MIKSNLKFIAIIAILLTTIFFLGRGLIRMNDEMLRQVHNFEQSLDSSKQIYYYTKHELKENQDSLLRVMMDSFKIRYKQIVQVHSETYNHVYDTTIYLIPTKSDSIWDFNHKFDECVSVKGSVNTGLNTITFDTLKTSYNSVTAVYWKRPYKLWFIRYGRKKFFIQNINNCSGESTVKEIEIVKQ